MQSHPPPQPTEPYRTLIGSALERDASGRRLSLAIAEHVYGWTWHDDEGHASPDALIPDMRAALRRSAARRNDRGPRWLLPPGMEPRDVRTQEWAWYNDGVGFVMTEPVATDDDRLVWEVALERPDIVPGHADTLVHALRLAGFSVIVTALPVVPYDGENFDDHRGSVSVQAAVSAPKGWGSDAGTMVRAGEWFRGPCGVGRSPQMGRAVALGALAMLDALPGGAPYPLLGGRARTLLAQYVEERERLARYL